LIRREPFRGRDQRLYRELLYALETARSRLAVAIAAENKATPRERWRRYLEMEDRMRKCVREIRRHHGGNSGKQFGWLEALSLLKQPLPTADRKLRGEAQQLCQRLSEVLNAFEGQPGDL
jgi:hypothetical protein